MGDYNVMQSFKLSFKQIQLRPLFWIGIALTLAITLPAANYGSLSSSILFIAGGLLLLGAINASILAASEKEYGIKDLFPNTRMLKCVAVMIIMIVGGWIFWVVIGSFLVFFYLTTNWGIFLILIAIIFAAWILLKISLAIFYILDMNYGVLESISHSWKATNSWAILKVSIGLMILSIPGTLLGKFFVDQIQFIDFTTLFSPWCELVWAHLYLEMKKSNQDVEPPPIAKNVY
jgi:hypothetical protein